MTAQNYKLVGLIKGYKMYLHLTLYENNIIFLTRQVLVRDYYASEILYYFFVYFKDFKCKNSKL
jgi:hypothetical protein